MLIMKCLLISLIVFVIAVNSVTRKSLFLPQLPVGAYRINFLAMMRCTPAPSNNYNQFNFYLSKKSANTSEIKGNITHLQPFDDSLDLEFDMAVKDSIGGWKENAFFYKFTKACSTHRTVYGDALNPIMKGLGMSNVTCPVPKLEFDMAVKDSIGGWKENAFFYKFTKACSTLRTVYGDAWNPIMSGLGMSNITCPVPKGYYILRGIDTAIFNSANFPKTFFYGTYRLRIRFTRNKIVYGCGISIIEMKRLWETD